MFNHKWLITVSVLLLVALAMPSWGASFRNVSEQQFLEMCKRGDLKGVIKAINSGTNVNAKDEEGDNALMWAATYGHIEIVRALLRAGA